MDDNTWIISDTHFGHKNIVKFCGRPMNHDNIMASNWHDLVQPDDTIVHLGDITYRGDRTDMLYLLKHLPGKKFYVKGNHDKENDRWYRGAGFEQIGDLLGTFIEEDVTRDGHPYKNTVKNYGFYWRDKRGRRILFSHYPDAWLLDWTINIHGHIHNNPPSPKIASNGRDYRNVSVELMDYRPVRLGDILAKHGIGEGTV
jgi:calcineurin-like phosphoesterase family protein